MELFINDIAHYLPDNYIPNDYFLDVNGIDNEWIIARTGIHLRTKAKEGENTNTMGCEAVSRLHIPLDDVDLIIGASYTPYDTVGTLAHSIQRKFNIQHTKAIYLSSACSSLINAIELAEAYFISGKAKKALVVASEHNSAYSNESCEKSGHLWGDGAVAIIIEGEKRKNTHAKIIGIDTQAMGGEGKGPDGVFLRPTQGGLLMPFGKDVFVNACKYMEKALLELLDAKNMKIDQVKYIIPHQANERIIQNIAKRINKERSIILSNIDKYGNTGCASTGICLSENLSKMNKGDIVGVTVFGGGYSAGALLLEFM